VSAWLRAHRPGEFEPALMHGDYHMLNVLMTFGDTPQVTAMVDWETATIGDPMLDLAGLCESWARLAEPGNVGERVRSPEEGPESLVVTERGSMAHQRSCPIARSAVLVRPARDDDRLKSCEICAAAATGFQSASGDRGRGA
jgi:hypothetical protein